MTRGLHYQIGGVKPLELLNLSPAGMGERSKQWVEYGRPHYAMLACVEFRRNAGLCKPPGCHGVTKHLYKKRPGPVRGFGSWRHGRAPERTSPAKGWMLVATRLSRHSGNGRPLADAKMASLSDTEVEEIERWLDVPVSWLMGPVGTLTPRCFSASGSSIPGAVIAAGSRPICRSLETAGRSTAPKGLCLPWRARLRQKENAPAISLAVVCRDGQRMAALSLRISIFAPEIQVLEFPAWDCLPYSPRVAEYGGEDKT